MNFLSTNTASSKTSFVEAGGTNTSTSLWLFMLFPNLTLDKNTSNLCIWTSFLMYKLSQHCGRFHLGQSFSWPSFVSQDVMCAERPPWFNNKQAPPDSDSPAPQLPISQQASARPNTWPLFATSVSSIFCLQATISNWLHGSFTQSSVTVTGIINVSHSARNCRNDLPVCCPGLLVILDATQFTTYRTLSQDSENWRTRRMTGSLRSKSRHFADELSYVVRSKLPLSDRKSTILQTAIEEPDCVSVNWTASHEILSCREWLGPLVASVNVEKKLADSYSLQLSLSLFISFWSHLHLFLCSLLSLVSDVSCSILSLALLSSHSYLFSSLSDDRRFGMPFDGPVLPFEQWSNITLWAKVLPGIFLGYALYAGGIWKGDVEELDASELHVRRLNAKEVVNDVKKWKQMEQ